MVELPECNAPLVGLTVEVLEAPWYEGRRRYQLFTDYRVCLRRAGAVPVLIPGDAEADELATILARLDGLLLTGGDDVDLRPLGGPAPTAECKPIPRVQQELNLGLVRAASEREMPMLGVCLGFQMMGLAFGAPYIQHLDAADQHTAGATHAVRVEPGSRLAALVGERTEVASYHHQGLGGPGEALRPVGWAEDGLLEAVELPDHPFALGVQWHPERTPDSSASEALFSGFVAAARVYGMQRNGARA